MAVTNISISITDKMLKQVDALVREGEYANRSEAVRECVRQHFMAQRGVLRGERGKEQLSEEDKAAAYAEYRKAKGWS